MRSIYGLEEGNRRGSPIAYRTLQAAEANRAVIREWHSHAATHGYQLSFMLIPPPHAFSDTALLAELASFLDELGIEVLDLTQEFAKSGAGRHQIYWRYDGHFTLLGNRIAADALIRRWGK